jgi:hypothetical protein
MSGLLTKDQIVKLYDISLRLQKSGVQKLTVAELINLYEQIEYFFSAGDTDNVKFDIENLYSLTAYVVKNIVDEWEETQLIPKITTH